MPTKFSPIGDNPFKNKNDIIDAFYNMLDPLLECFSPGKAQVQVDGSGASFDRNSISQEGFCRPLWAIVPLILGGSGFKYADIFRQGLTNGTDPSHEEYWGDINEQGQPQVEMAALGFALKYAKKELWDPLSAEAKQNVGKYLLSSRNLPFFSCNWKFFRVLVDIGLENVGVDFDKSLTKEALDDVDSYYCDNGWYSDGVLSNDIWRIDNYNPFAIHFYGLIYAANHDDEFSKKFVARANKFAEDYIYLYANDGSTVPFGRSLTYRFAVAGFWSALAWSKQAGFNKTCPFSYGVIKGIILRQLRWWAQWPISVFKTDLLSVGYCYPNRYMSECYNSPCSPYWALKAFMCLAIPDGDEFWSVDEEPLLQLSSIHGIPTVGFAITRNENNVTLFSSGMSRLGSSVTAEKYGKFAYSSRYAFSMETFSRYGGDGVYDNMIAVSEDNKHYCYREICLDARYLADNILYSKWRPIKGVDIETWVIPIADSYWHARVHKIVTTKDISTIEGGFTIHRDTKVFESTQDNKSYVESREKDDFSGIVDPSGHRAARIQRPFGNTNLYDPFTILPQLVGTISANSTVVYTTLVFVCDGTERAASLWKSPPTVPSIEDLERRTKSAPQITLVTKFKDSLTNTADLDFVK